MSQAEQDRRVDYLEFPTANMEETKRFYSEIFGWEFTDYGPEYTSFHDGRLAGGFFAAPQVTPGGPLVVLYATNLEDTEAKIKEAGGIVQHRMAYQPNSNRNGLFMDSESTSMYGKFLDRIGGTLYIMPINRRANAVQKKGYPIYHAIPRPAMPNMNHCKYANFVFMRPAAAGLYFFSGCFRSSGASINSFMV